MEKATHPRPALATHAVRGIHFVRSETVLPQAPANVDSPDLVHASAIKMKP